MIAHGTPVLSPHRAYARSPHGVRLLVREVGVRTIEVVIGVVDVAQAYLWTRGPSAEAQYMEDAARFQSRWNAATMPPVEHEYHHALFQVPRVIFYNPQTGEMTLGDLEDKYVVYPGQEIPEAIEHRPIADRPLTLAPFLDVIDTAASGHINEDTAMRVRVHFHGERDPERLFNLVDWVVSDMRAALGERWDGLVSSWEYTELSEGGLAGQDRWLYDLGSAMPPP